MSNPFVGPQPFGKDNLIYGRDEEISELRYFLGAKRIVVLYSPSGAGKTSLIQARNGLIAKLRESGRFDVWGPARVNLAPGPLPVTNRFAWSAINGFEKSREAGVRPPETFAQTKLVDYVNERATETSPLLIFDQFEEVLRTDPTNLQDKHDFFDQLGELLYQPTVWALFVLREDWLAALQPYVRQVPTHLQSRFRLDLLRRADQAQCAIVEPLAAVGRHFANDQVINDLLDDLARIKVDGKPTIGETVEPLQLQVVGQNIWSKIEGHDPADPIVAQDIGDPSDALATYYRNNVMQSSVDEERPIRDWFDKALISEEGIRTLVLLEHDGAAGLPAKTIDALEPSGLFRKESRAGATWIELCHDRLVEPIRNDNKEWRIRNLSTLQKAADLWLDRGRSPDLYLRGPSLIDAKLWAEDHVLQDFEREFLNQSIAEEKKRQLWRAARVAIIVLGVAAIAAGIWALQARASALVSEAKAEKEKADAIAARAEAEAAQDNALTQEQRARRSAVRADLALVAQQADNGSMNQALAYLARALNTSPESVTARAWAAGLLGRGNHRLPLREFLHDGPVDLVEFGGQPNRILTVQLQRRSSSIQLWDRNTGERIGKPLLTSYRVRAVSASPSGVILTVPDRSPDLLPDSVKDYPRGAASCWTWRGRWVEEPLDSFKYELPLDARFTPGYQSIVTLANGDVRIWNAATRKPLGDPLHLDEPIQGLALSRDGKLTAVRTGSNVFLFQTGGPLLAQTGPLDGLSRIDFSWDARRLITVAKRGVTVWNFNADGTLAEFANKPFDLPVTKAMIGYDNRLITVVAGDVSSWDLATKELRPVLSIGKIDSNASQWELSPDGRQLMVVSLQGLNVWELRTGDQVAEVQHSGWIQRAAFSRDGRYLIAGSDDRVALLWNVGSKRTQSRLFRQRASVRAIAFDPQDRLVVATSNGVAIWQADPQHPPQDQEPQQILEGSPVAQVGFHGPLMHTVSWNRQRNRWEVDLWLNGRKQNAQPLWHLGRISLVAISPDGHHAFTSSNDGTGRLWDATAGTPLGEPMWHGQPAVFAAFTADGSRLISAAGRNLFAWDPGTGKLLRHYPLASHVASAALVRNDTAVLLAFDDPDSHVRLQSCDLKSGTLTELERHTDSVALVTAAGHRALSSSINGQDGAQLWDLTGSVSLPIGSPLLHAGDILTALFNGDGSLAVTASADKTAQVWDAATGLALGQPLLHGSPVKLAAFRSNYVATVAEDFVVHVWDFKACSDKDPQAGKDLATLAEVVGGSRLSDDATLTRIPLEERRNLLRNLLRGNTRHSPDVDALIKQLADNSGVTQP